MFARFIRCAILESPRYLSLTPLQKIAFLHLLLLADDYGCVLLSADFIRRRVLIGKQETRKGYVGDGHLEHLVAALEAAGVLRIYEHEGTRYGWIPRYKQHPRRIVLKHPAPPESIYQDEPDARKRFAVIPMGAQRGTLPTHKQVELPIAPPLQVELPMRALAAVASAPAAVGVDVVKQRHRNRGRGPSAYATMRDKRKITQAEREALLRPGPFKKT